LCYQLRPQMASTKIKTAFERWIPTTHLEAATDGVLAVNKYHDYDPKMVLEKSAIGHVFSVARELKLSTLCALLALDVAKVVAPPNLDPRVQAAIHAAELCLAAPTKKNRAAVSVAGCDADMAAFRGVSDEPAHAARSAAHAARSVWSVFVGWGATYAAEDAVDAARNAAERHPVLIHQLDAREARFRDDVHNSLVRHLRKSLHYPK